MPIVYALIARKKSVLAEFTSSSGNFPTVTRVLLAKIPEQDGKMSYVYDKHIFHFIVDNGITFLCMADEGMKRRIAFSFLEDIKNIWREKYASVEQSALPFAMNESFSNVLRQRIEFYSLNSSSTDNISKVQAQLDSVKDVMVENIDRVLQRGEKIELLVDKSEQLSSQAKKFEKSSKSLKDVIYWRRIRNIAIVTVILLLVIFFIVLFSCGFQFERCKAK